ncbi:MAG TPA: dTMP kinase [Myxococcales bacterium]|jgi:dTMP kinase|nr:dTMP kinase [Myxococcales bacterium]
MSARGLFVVLEGIDGAGTTTQAERISAALRAEGRRVLTTREPSDGPLGLLLRQALAGRLGLPRQSGPLSPETLALLFAADRTDHLAAQVRPALAAGVVVVCDRYVLSSLAYQGAQLPPRWVEAVNAFADAPDLTLFLEVEPEVAARRRASRGGDAELYDADHLQRRIARQYLTAIRRRGRTDRVVRIAGDLSVEQVTAVALAAIHRRLAGRKR